MKKKLIELDILRAFAILIIYFHHVSWYSFNFWDIRYFGIPLDLSFFHENLFGFLGLGLFIFLSGYAIQYSAKIKTVRDVLLFWKKRIIRIMPLYWLGLFVFIVIIERLSLKSMIIHMLGLQILLSPKWIMPIATLWYIGLILIFYFIYMGVSLVSKNNKQFIIFLSGAYLLAFFIHIIFNIIEYRFFLYYFVFMSGVLCCKYEGQINKIMSLKLHIMLLIISIIIVVLFKIPQEITINTLLFHLNANVMLTSFSILMLSVTRLYGLRLNHILVKILQFIAYSSYVVYLIHKPVWHILLKIYSPESMLGKGVYIILFGLFIVVIAAYFIQLGYDYFVKIISRRVKAENTCCYSVNMEK